MKQYHPLSDNRLLELCVFCGGEFDTKDHVPSKTFLDKPYPENLPVVGCCESCNRSFSKDEQYLSCLIECVIAGSTDPDLIKRKSVSKTLKRSPKLRERIQQNLCVVNGITQIQIEPERVTNVMLKLARGHSAYELSQPVRVDPSKFWCGNIESLSPEQRNIFESVPDFQSIAEVGSRNMQRLAVVQPVGIPIEGGEPISFEGFLFNDWLEVQEGNYRYLAIDDSSQIIIRIVISEYLACEAVWTELY